jgi:hypothetical protein
VKIIYDQKSLERTARPGNRLPIMTDDEHCSIAEYVRRDLQCTPGERHTVEFSQLFAGTESFCTAGGQHKRDDV